MTAQDILKLIESVDPSDTAKLDEIDARVWCWLFPKELEYYGTVENYFQGIAKTKQGLSNGLKQWHPNYTRSRDALKAIRPEGWSFYMNQYGEPNSHTCIMSKFRGLPAVHAGKLPTEELAELHATIQAIDYERNHEKKFEVA